MFENQFQARSQNDYLENIFINVIEKMQNYDR